MKHLIGAAAPEYGSFSALPQAPGHLLPLAALMLAGSLGMSPKAHAQSEEKTLRTVTVKDAQDPNLSKDNVWVKQAGIAKGNQQLKDIPQTVTVMTEKLITDRNLDDFRKVLQTTAGVTFLSGETGEEDVRMRGFSLQQAGDIYVDGLRDAPLIERDTFNIDRVEVLKGSASMLFGKGSTGGVVNQVNKQPFLMDQNEANVTVGSGNTKRITADMNKQTGESSAFRLNAMTHQADNWGAKVDKKGVAGAYRTGIGERDEYAVGVYHLETNGRPLYSHPWMVDNGSAVNGGPRGSGANDSGTLVPVLAARDFYGMSSDHLRTDTTYGTLSHKHRFNADSELKTVLRAGHYSRDLLGTQVGFNSLTSRSALDDSTLLKRAPKSRYGDSDLLQLQSDYTSRVEWLGHRHSLMAGIDFNTEHARRNNNAVPSGWSYPTTTVGTPNNGDSVADIRAMTPTLSFNAQNIGAYAQDTLQITDTLKVQGGLRLEKFSATYTDQADNSAGFGKTRPSPRVGVLWQPDANTTYYGSYGTSYNTSGDTYAYAVGTSLAAQTLQGGTLKPNPNLTTLNTPPEQSRNIELGSKFELFEGRSLLGVAAFYSEKYNERNTDVDTATNQYLLSGKRHATGMEFNFAGRITPAWEVFYNHTWIPVARIDVSSATGNMKQGDRPGLTPEHSASLWSTYALHTTWRVGGGLNYRGAQTPLTNSKISTASFTTADAMLEHNVTDDTTLKLNVSNLSNKLYIDQVYTSFYIPGAPRRVELSLKTMF